MALFVYQAVRQASGQMRCYSVREDCRENQHALAVQLPEPNPVRDASRPLGRTATDRRNSTSIAAA